jgi:hypothetical protein
VRCIYGNVCKNLDENFKKVRCGSLWPREYLHAPEMPHDRDAPVWPDGGAQLQAQLYDNGTLRLQWKAALDEHGVYGYEIFRAVNAGPFVHLTSSMTANHVDEYALAGNRYSYYVRAYDFAGNRSRESNHVQLIVDPAFAIPADRSLELDGDVEAQMGFSA